MIDNSLKLTTMNTNTLTIFDVASTPKLAEINIALNAAKAELLFLANKQNEYYELINTELVNNIRNIFNKIMETAVFPQTYELKVTVSHSYIKLQLVSESDKNCNDYIIQIYKEEDWGDFSNASPNINYEIHYPAFKVKVGENNLRIDRYMKLMDFVNDHSVKLVEYYKEFYFKMKNNPYDITTKIAQDEFKTQTKLFEQEQNDILDNTISSYREQDKVVLKNVSELFEYPEPHILECNGFTFNDGPYKIPEMSFFKVNKRNKKTINVSFYCSNYDGNEKNGWEVSLTNELYESLLRSAAVWNLVHHLNVSQRAINKYYELMKK